MDTFTEDWNESQFWYSDETARLLATQLLEGVTEDMTVAVVSAPSVFVALKNILNSAPPEQPKPNLVLLEHDNRFNVFPEFVFYDYTQPLKLPAELKGTCDRIICDPPFLNEDCQTKAALTARWLARHTAESNNTNGITNGTTNGTTNGNTNGSNGTNDTNGKHNNHSTTRIIVCTGERMQDVVLRVYRAFGLRTTDYEPTHARGLSNEFYSYANFESDAWGWRDEGR